MIHLRKCFMLGGWFLGASLPAGFGQTSFYENLEFATYKVGFADTLIFNEELTYEQFGYKGPAPLFVQVWYPLGQAMESDQMAFYQFREREVPENLRQVYRQLCKELDSSFVAYNIKEEFSTYDPIDYGSYSYGDVLQMLKSYRTRSHHKPLLRIPGLPVIVYHHGSQGLSDENFIIGEFFASKGYLFLSSNFHLPYENQPFGLREGVSDNSSNLETVLAFARSLAGTEWVIFIGHSWGAQVGWTYLHRKGWADAFVSWETTMEFKQNLEEIQNKWPFVFTVLQQRKEKFSLPILHIANTRQNQPFPFFEGHNTKPTYFVTAREEFGHESYTSAYLLRYFFGDQLKLPDAESLKGQVVLYGLHLQIIERFLGSVLQGQPFPGTEFSTSFFIQQGKAGSAE